MSGRSQSNGDGPWMFRRLQRWDRKASLPGWWTLATIGGTLLLIAYLIGSALFSSAPSGPYQSTARPQSTPTTIGVVPNSPAATPSTGLTQASTATTDLVDVPLLTGGMTQVPAAALATAALSFEAMYSSAAAAQVKAVDGGTAPKPGMDSDGRVGTVTLMSPDTGAATSATLIFAADVDLDGTGPLSPIRITRTLVLSGPSWRLNI